MSKYQVLAILAIFALAISTVLSPIQNGLAADGLETQASPEIQLVDYPMINEFMINNSGADTHSFIEIISTPSADLSALTLLLVEGDSTGNPGKIITTLSIGTTDGNGIWDSIIPNEATDDGTTTLLLVSGWSFASDIDTNNDGQINGPDLWDILYDSVAIHDGVAGGYTYMTDVVLTEGYDGLPGVPGGASRIPDGVDTDTVDDWMRNDPDLAGLLDGTATLGEALNTPGELNLAVPIINEFVYNHDGQDKFEFFEIKGAPNTIYDRVKLLVVESDAVSQQGKITNIVSFTWPTNEGGYDAVFATEEQSVLDNSVTLLLVYGFTGAAGADLDADNDGIIDVTPWMSLIDSVGVMDDDVTDFVYSNVILEPGYDGIDDYPGGASRIPDGFNTEFASDWMRNDFSFEGVPDNTTSISLNEAANTPGEENWGWHPSNDLLLTKDGPHFVDPGDLVEYHIVVENLSIVKAVDTKLTETLPPDTIYVSDTSGLTYTNPAAGVYEWNLGDLPAGYKLEFDLTLQLSAESELGWIYNNMNLTSRLPESDKDNNVVSEKTYIRQSLLINEIQGAAHTSPKEGFYVIEVPGIVTGVGDTGFFMQSPGESMDDQLATSEGVLVYQGESPTVSVGDLISVTATVAEFYPDGYESGNLSTTMLVNDLDVAEIVIDVIFQNYVPIVTVVGADGIKPPTEIITDDSTGDVEDSPFDPILDGIDFYESLEGMLLGIEEAIVVGPTNSDGEIAIVPDAGDWATGMTPRGGIVIQAGDFNPERIILPGSPDLDTGTVFAAPIQGILDYSKGNYKLLSTGALPSVDAATLEKEITDLEREADQITVATLNVENLDPNPDDGDDDTDRFAALAGQIVNNLDSPDIIVLQEIQDNSGEIEDDGIVAADETYQMLVDAIDALTEEEGPVYSFVDIPPVYGQDGGAPGGNIRVGFLYRVDRGLEFVLREPDPELLIDLAITPTTLSLGVTGVELSYSPGRIDPTNAAWLESRKPLVGEFVFNNRKLFVIGNHFNSKSGDSPLFGRVQPLILLSEAQRVQQAQVVNSFVDEILALDPTALVVVAGDLNDFQFSNPLLELEGGVLTNLHSLNPIEEQYTYIYDGNSQALDHILVSDQLMASGVAVDVVHVNAEYVERASDHDPVLARFTLPPVEVNLGEATYQVDEAAGTLTITVVLEATSTQEVSVDYTTSDGTAVVDEDYTLTSGTISFLPTEPATLIKEIVIPILADDIAEYLEDFFLTLSNPINAELGDLIEATITISDDDWLLFLPLVVK